LSGGAAGYAVDSRLAVLMLAGLLNRPSDSNPATVAASKMAADSAAKTRVYAGGRWFCMLAAPFVVGFRASQWKQLCFH